MKTGESHSEITKQKISESMRGKPKTQTTRERMSFAASVRWAKERQKHKKAAAELRAVEPVNIGE